MKLGDTVVTRDGQGVVVKVGVHGVTIRTGDGKEYDIGTQSSGATGKAKRPKEPRSHFDGFSREDFKNNVAGTSWRSRTCLGGEVTKCLERENAAFNSFTVYRKPEVHWADADVWDKENPARHAKLLVRLTPENARFGLCVERQASKYALSEDWRRFAAWISSPAGYDQVSTLMRDGSVSFCASGKGIPISLRPVDASWQVTMTDASFSCARERLGEFLTDFEKEDWLGCYIQRTLLPEEAIAMKSGVTNSIADTFNLLLSIYQVATRG